MRYLISNPRGGRLDMFTPNDLTGSSQLHYSSRSWYSFPSVEEAEHFIDYIQSRAAGKSKSAALNLRVEVES